jgi:hypothetical protein
VHAIEPDLLEQFARHTELFGLRQMAYIAGMHDKQRRWPWRFDVGNRAAKAPTTSGLPPS